MTEFVMLCGLPASGKTSFAENLKYNGYNIHSSDVIRKELFDSEECQENNSAVFDVLHGRIKADLISGKNTVYDATSINWKRRRNFLKEITKYDCKKILIVFATPYEYCLGQNSERERNVPEEVITRMYRNFNFPYYYEGWDEIKIEWNYNPQDYVLEYDLAGLNEYNQDTPHHSLTLGRHLESTAQYLLSKTQDEKMFYLGYLHDIGKPYCRAEKFDKELGINKSTYYDHHMTSAYNAMFYLKSFGFNDEDIVFMCATIYWHMQPYFCEKEKTLNKYKNLWGEDLYNNIMILHEADIAGH